MIRPITALLITVAMLLPAAAGGEIVERIAAIVNDQIILMSQVEEVAKSWQSMLVSIRDPEQRMSKQREVYRKVLDQLIEDLLLEQQLEELDFKISEREVDQAIERVIKQNNIPDIDSLKKALIQQGINWGDYREQVSKQLRKWQFINAKVGSRVKISDQEVEDEWEKEQVSQSRDYEYRARHILFRVRKEDTEEIDAAQRAKAEAAMEKLKQGADFAQLAIELSEGPTARHGGDLGYFRNGIMVHEFEEPVTKLEINQISGIIRTPFGYHIVQLTDKRPIPGKSFEQAKGEIRNRLREEEMKREMATWLRQLREKAFIDIKLDDPPAAVAAPIETEEEESQ